MGSDQRTDCLGNGRIEISQPDDARACPPALQRTELPSLDLDRIFGRGYQDAVPPTGADASV
jgi:hypothetical protein